MLQAFHYRKFQQDTINEVLTGRFHRTLIVAPTGSGKTTIVVELVDRLEEKGRVLFLAHRLELMSQIQSRAEAKGCSVGVVTKSIPDTQCIVGSVQKMVRRPVVPGVTLIVIDEAHRATAPSYRKILSMYPDARVIGLTATPFRSDGTGLGQIFDNIVVAATPLEMIDQGYILKPRILAPRKFDYYAMKKRGRDIDVDVFADEVAIHICGEIVEHYQNECSGRTAVVFCCNIDHSKVQAQKFRDAGIPAAHLDGTTPIEQRIQTLQRLDCGDIKVLCNVGILCEGWDMPSLGVAIIARPTLSAGLYLQMVGRVVRPLEGKKTPLILDHAGCTYEHGFPWADREFTLEDGLKDRRRKRNEIRCRICTYCGSVNKKNTSFCFSCDRSFGQTLPNVQEASCDLVEIEDTTAVIKNCHCGEDVKIAAKAGEFRLLLECTADKKHLSRWIALTPARTTKQQKQKEYNRLLHICRRNGFKKGWAAHKYKEVFGVWPRNLEEKSGCRRNDSFFEIAI